MNSCAGELSTISLWDLYKFSYSLAIRSFSSNFLKSAARLVFEPCTYWRNVEVPAVINHLAVQPREKVLDIGSPKLASLFLWARLKAELYATDLFPYFVQEYKHLHQCLKNLGVASEYHIGIQDGRSLDYPDGYFDKVYAISVIEHIEENGDSQAMREIARVLKAGGLCCLTVPYAARYREDMTERKLYFKNSAPGKPVFFQRHYDGETLQSRLIAPSKLHPCVIEYFGERWFGYERFYDNLPLFLKIPFLLPGPVFSKLFLYKLTEESRAAAKTALLLLRKNRKLETQ